MKSKRFKFVEFAEGKIVKKGKLRTLYPFSPSFGSFITTKIDGHDNDMPSFVDVAISRLNRGHSGMIEKSYMA